MSVVAMEAAVRVAAPSHTAKLVMMVLAWHHNANTGRCFPSYERIAEEAGLAKSSVMRAIKELEGAQLIRKAQGRRVGRKNASNHYVLVFIARLGLERKERHRGYERDGRAALPKPEGSSSSLRSEEGAPKPRKRSQKRAARRRLTPDWRPSKKLFDQAVQSGFSVEEVERMLLDFRDYYIARGEVSAVWGMDWSRWVRRQKDFKEADDARSTGTGPLRRGDERLASVLGSHAAAMEAARDIDGRGGGSG